MGWMERCGGDLSREVQNGGVEWTEWGQSRYSRRSTYLRRDGDNELEFISLPLSLSNISPSPAFNFALVIILYLLIST